VSRDERSRIFSGATKGSGLPALAGDRRVVLEDG
jgi:hypothetical protein